MEVLNRRDYKLLERLFSLSQEGLKRAMSNYIKTIYKDFIITDKYIVGIGEIPIALVAHMDTVYSTPVQDLFYDSKKGVMWSPDGLGADDRAGIFAIIHILQSGYKPSVILTTDEEKGGLGASALGECQCPIPNLKYMIELDRSGVDDCVFYQCCNTDFVKYVENFGFVEKVGTFSDISFLMTNWGICGVNLSIGYINEHDYSEMLYIQHMFNTIDKVKNMLNETEIPEFEYNEVVKNYKYFCDNCGKTLNWYEAIMATGKDYSIKLYCSDCCVDHVYWCEECGEAFEKSPEEKTKICKDCWEGTNVRRHQGAV